MRLLPGLTVDALGASGRRFVREYGATLPKGRPVSYLDVYAAAATEILLDAIDTRGAKRIGVIDPPARLVGPSAPGG